MKKVTIIRAAGNELANQLWNYASIYAYTLERQFLLKNPSFFEYGEYFKLEAAPNIFFRLAFFLPFRNYTKRKTAFQRKLWRKIYLWYTSIILKFHEKYVIRSNDKENTPYYLPPSAPPTAELSSLEKVEGYIYFDGWLFRNPTGLKKYHAEIKKYFELRADIKARVDSNVRKLRESYPFVVGIHLRQGDYITWRGGTYLIQQKRVREILDEYLKKIGRGAEKTCFAICSDGAIDASLFKGLNIFVSREDAVHDLFFLAGTDIIIGSNSTFGTFASYLGNIPLLVMDNGPIDWDYYKNKNVYFENKYLTMVHF